MNASICVHVSVPVLSYKNIFQYTRCNCDASLTYLLILSLTHCPRGEEVPGGGTWEWREHEGERMGREELRHGAGTVPQVPHRKGSWVGGALKEMCRGVGRTTARLTKSIRAPPDPLKE